MWSEISGHLFQYWYALPVVALGCTMTIMGGVGGNVVCGPFFILVLRLSPEAAIGTALVTEVFSMSSGVIGYWRRRLIDYKLGLILGAAAAPMAVAGSLLSVRAPSALLKVLFGTAIILIALLLFRVPREAELECTTTFSEPHVPGTRRLIDAFGWVYTYQVCQLPQLFMTSMLAGIGSGLVAIGGGEFNTPSMVMRCRIPLRVAAATSVFVMALTVLAGASTHVLVGKPVWNLVIWTVPGAIVGGQVGSYLASRLASGFLKKWLSGLFVTVGMVMIFNAVLFK